MSALPRQRKGWCPGALRPMATGDGLLARVRARGGRLSLDQAEAIADAAPACGNGVLGLSARANLQIRGVSEQSLPDLQARLAGAKLLDDDPEVERLRNIVVSPLSDMDPEAAFDLTPCVEALEARLAEDKSLRPLPGKFGFAFEAGGFAPLGGVEADIGFEALAGTRAFAVYLGGDDEHCAFCAVEDAPESAARLARAFLSLTDRLAGAASDEPRRMRALVARVGADDVFAEASLAARVRPRARRNAPLARMLGAHILGGEAVVGLAAPLGQIGAASLKALVAHARAAGAQGLRLAPRRMIFVTGAPVAAAHAFAVLCGDLGFVVDASDKRLRIAACPGAPACLHARRPLRLDAKRFARLLPDGEGVLLHMSGCAKGCACPKETPLTLVATEKGYDLIVDGRACDAPAARGLSAGAALAWIERRFASEASA